MRKKLLTSLVLIYLMMICILSTSLLAASSSSEQSSGERNNFDYATAQASDKVDQNYTKVLNYCQDILNGKVEEGTDWTNLKDVLYMNIGYCDKNDVYYWLGDLTGDDQDELVISRRYKDTSTNAYIYDPSFYDKGALCFAFTVSNGAIKVLDNNSMPSGSMEYKWVTTDKLIGTHENDSSYSMTYPYYQEDLTYTDGKGNFVLRVTGHKNNPPQAVNREYSDFVFSYVDKNGNPISGEAEFNWDGAKKVVDEHPIMNILQYKLIDFNGELRPNQSVNPDGSISIYRLFNSNTGEHLYTSDKNEAILLTTQMGWTDEGVGWNAPSSGTPVYRLFNPTTSDHLYTTDTWEIQVITTEQGWQLDNNGEPLFYSGGKINIYRLFSPETGRHHLTTDSWEYKVLPQQGWQQEGKKLKAMS